MSQSLYPPFPECPKPPSSTPTTNPSITENSFDGIPSSLPEIVPDPEIGFLDLENQIEDRRHRHLLTDEEYEELVQDLLTERTAKNSLGLPFLELFPNLPLSPSIEAIPRCATFVSPGTITQSMLDSDLPLWAVPTYATSRSVVLTEEPVIFKVTSQNLISWTHFFCKKPGKRLT